MKVLILGATSAIAQAAGRVWAARGATLHLVARNPERLRAVAEDLSARGAAVTTSLHDLNDASCHAELAAHGADVVLLAQGIQGEAAVVDADPAAAELVLRTNFVAPVQILTVLAQAMKPGSTLAVISSVAADRGRSKPVAVYSSSKAGLDAFLSGLRQRMVPAGVRVLTVKPGYVDTPMTARHLPKNALFVAPDVVGRGIVKAVDRKSDIVYLPWFWRVILFGVRSIPERFFKKLRI